MSLQTLTHCVVLSTDMMNRYIKKYLIENMYSYEIETISNSNDVTKIYNLLINNNDNTFDDNDSDTVMLYYGIYYHIKKDYYHMKNCYLLAIEHGNDIAMRNIACYYNYIHDYDLMKKYYLMAIEKGNSRAMVDLGFYYQYIEINHDLMKKYYLMAIDNDHTESVTHLLNFYKKNKNYEEIIPLIIRSNRYDLFENNGPLKITLFSYTFTNEDLKIIASKSKDDILLAPHIIKVLHNSLNTQIDSMKLHFDYSVNGIGYDKAKEHFISSVNHIEKN